MIHVNLRPNPVNNPSLHVVVVPNERDPDLTEWVEMATLFVDLYNSRALRWRYLAIVHGEPFDEDVKLEEVLARYAPSFRRGRPASDAIRAKAVQRSHEANLVALQILRHSLLHITNPSYV